MKHILIISFILLITSCKKEEYIIKTTAQINRENIVSALAQHPEIKKAWVFESGSTTSTNPDGWYSAYNAPFSIEGDSFKVKTENLPVVVVYDLSKLVKYEISSNDLRIYFAK